MCCRGAEVDVRRLTKRPAPPRFGKKLTEAQKASFFLNIMSLSSYRISAWITLHIPKSLLIACSLLQARATHICLDCGYIYTLQKPFDEQASLFNLPRFLSQIINRMCHASNLKPVTHTILISLYHKISQCQGWAAKASSWFKICVYTISIPSL